MPGASGGGAYQGRRVAVRINIRAIGNNGLLAADAIDVVEAFGGWVRKRPGLTMTPPIHLDSLQNGVRPTAPPPTPPLALTLAQPPTIVVSAMCVKGGQRWRSGATFGCGGGSGGGRGGEGLQVRENIIERLSYFSFASISLVLCSNTVCIVLRFYIVVHRVVFLSY
jgi:hypothetical protein